MKIHRAGTSEVFRSRVFWFRLKGSFGALLYFPGGWHNSRGTGMALHHIVLRDPAVYLAICQWSSTVNADGKSLWKSTLGAGWRATCCLTARRQMTSVWLNRWTW